MPASTFTEAAATASNPEEDRRHEDGSTLNRLSVSATLHCMTGCVIGEIVGLAVATALGWSTFGQIGLAVGLAYLFGFAFTSVPLARAGLTFGAIVPIALATDTVSITIMELIANATMLLVPGAMSDRILDAAMWATMALGFAIAFPFAFLANRWLLRRGKGHALVHEYHRR
jgi:hypothetical protein